jgi:hypothetical protein
MEKKALELKSYQLIKKGLLILLVLEAVIFLIFGVRFFGVLLKNTFMLLFVAVNITIILLLYWYFSYREKTLKEELKR